MRSILKKLCFFGVGIITAFILIFRPTTAITAGPLNYSLRFYGHGTSDIDRVKIPIDPHVPADISNDFTIEFWLKALAAENTSSSCTPGSVNWIYGNIILDRDIYGDGDYGDYGVSLAGGRIAFGVAQGSNAQTICSNANVADGTWHHIALTRDGSTGQMNIFVDGILDATGNGPIGDISYRDSRTTSYPNSDPYLVIGAEKHDAGSSYPSYNGFLDELRISTIVRYASNFSPPTTLFTTDGQTAALYHFDEGPAGPCTGMIVDAVGTSPGQCKHGGIAPSGPVYSNDTPFSSSGGIPQTAIFLSIGAQDGWILESRENSNTGGLLNATGLLLNLGDDARDRQYRAILSFNTAALPDNATIVGVTLKLKSRSTLGTNPFTTHGNILVDIRQGAFGMAKLQLSDFNAVASQNNVSQISGVADAGNWYSAVMGSEAFGYVNKTGLTQFRLQFLQDDDDDMRTDYISFFSGNAAAANRPMLIVEYLPPSSGGSSPSPTEWSQHAHDAQHSGYTAEVVSYPWRWKWVWNGSNSSGGVSKVTTSGTLPRNVQPVTGGGRVYVAAGVDGVFALSENNGQVLWQRNALGDVRSTVAYDADTQAVFVVSANGRLYKLDASNGNIIAQFNSGQSSNLPLPPALAAGRVFFSMGNSIYALNKYTLELVWSYDAGAIVAVPPAYSPSRDIVIIATEPDLYVHAVRNSDGNRLWRVRPVHSSLNFNDPTEYRFGWPVIAENAGVVLIKVRLHWERLWRDWPQTNPEMRQLLINNPGDQALFVLDLDDGTIPFIANVGHGGYGDTDYLPMGPQPVVKPLGNGKDVVYTIIRAKHAYDSRWDSHFGEMVLDNSTVSGLQGGYVRFIAFDWPPGSTAPFLLTDEQPNVTMAGDYLFGGHWEAGFALQILDRSPGFGTFTNKIPSQRLATVATSQDNPACAFSPSHYCASQLENTRPYDFGFYIYYNQGAVYDQYWSEYAVWVVSNGNVYFRSTDGAIVALTSGNPQSFSPVTTTIAVSNAPSLPKRPTPAVISFSEARQWAGHRLTVVGTIRHVAYNGKHLLIGFARPHQGTFKAIIRQADFENFALSPQEMYFVGQHVAITGEIGWYQGDPVIYVSMPSQIQELPSVEQAKFYQR